MQFSQTIRTRTHKVSDSGWVRLNWPNIPSLHILRGIALIIAALTLLPLGYLVIRASGAGLDGLEYLLSARTLNIVMNSLKLTAAVTLSSAFIGLLFAWLTTRTDLPFRKYWQVSGLLTLVIPSFIGALAYIAAFGPHGLLQQMLEPLGVTTLPSIYGFTGAWLAITMFTYPYVVLPVRAALMNMDPALEETARSLGMGRWRVFLRVTLPQLRPAVATGVLLTALYTLSDFGAVALMRYNAFTRAIFLQYTSSFDRNRAAILSLVLVVIALGLLALERRIAASTRNYRAGGSSTSRQMRTVSLGKWRYPALAFCFALITIGLLVPVAILATWLLQGMSAGLDPLASTFTIPTLNTIGASGLTAAAVGLVALPLALLATRASSRTNRWLVNMTYLGNSLPGLVVALAIVFFASNYLPSFYQTLPILVLGYALRYLPLSVGATRSALTQFNPRLEEAGRSLGLNPYQVVTRITVPLVRTGILGGMALVFLSVMKELPSTLLLAPTGFKTLATQIWTAQNEAYFTQIGAPALLLIATSALSLMFVLGRDSTR